MLDDQNKNLFIECIVGNIIDKHYSGEQKIILRGTKHFRPGAKVYCIFMYGGMGHERVRVLGKPRKDSRMIDIVMSTNHIKNLRYQKVYDLKVISFINKHPTIPLMPLDFLETCNENNVEIRG